jgi:intracellular septation protein A
MESSQATIKHWRSFGIEEWGHVKEGAIGLVLGSLLPVLLFYVGYRTWGFSVAVVIVLSWSAAVFAWHYRRGRGADVFSATTFGFACVKAAAGLVSQTTLPEGAPISAVTLYLAWPSLENLVYGTAFFGSALLGRPLLALFAQRLYPIPSRVRSTHTFRRAFLIASAAWLCGHVLRAVVRLWLLANLPLELYLIADTVAGWPINISLVAFTTWFPLRQLRRAGLVSIAAVPLSAADAVELAVEEAAPSTV